MIAYCFRSGQIGFSHKLPEGTIKIIEGHGNKIRPIVETCARWSYPSTRGGKDSKPLVPGIPEAKSEEEAFIALETFIHQIKKRLYPVVSSHPNESKDGGKPPKMHGKAGEGSR